MSSKSNNNPSPNFKPKPRITSSQINYASLSDIVANRHSLTESQEILFRTAHFHVKRMSPLYTEEYYDNAALVIGAEPVFAKKYCFCGASNKKNASGRCNKRHFCRRCANSKAYKHWLKLQKSFNKGDYYFVTFMWDGAVKFSDNTSIDCSHLHLNAINYAISQAIKAGLFNGGIVSEEIAVVNFLPCMIQPHVHAIIECDYFDDKLKRKLLKSIRKYRDKAGHRVVLKPLLQFAHIKDRELFERQFRYLFKPMDIKTAYSVAWDQRYMEDRKNAWRLNNELKNFMQGNVELTKDRKMIRLFGNMHAKSKQYNGDRKMGKIGLFAGKTTKREVLDDERLNAQVEKMFRDFADKQKKKDAGTGRNSKRLVGTKERVKQAF